MFRILAIGLSVIALAQSPGELTSIYCTVWNAKGQLIPNVRPEDLKVLEDRREVKIQSVSPATGPLDLGVLLDTSTGVISTLELEAEAASSFLSAAMRPGDLGFTMSYNSQVDVLQAPAEDTRLLARNTARVAGYGRYVTAPQPKRITLEPVPAPIPLPLPAPLPGKPPTVPQPPVPVPGNRTRGNGAVRSARLYDAAIEATNRFLTRENGRGVIVVFALADDSNSTSSIQDALRVLKRRGVTVYVLEVEPEGPGVGALISGIFRRATVIRRDKFDVPAVFSTAPESRIGRLAEETGGRVIRVKGFHKAREAFAEIADDLRRQQRVTFIRSNAEDDGTSLVPLEVRTAIKGGRVYAANAYRPIPSKRP